MKIEIKCCLCRERFEQEIDIPGWQERYDNITSEMGFCPKHSAVAEFADDQCAGCVGGWMDCGLWSSFVYSGRRTISENDLKIIETGICPKRVNGTFSMRSPGGEIKDINLSSKATTKAGKSFADAIRDYCQTYPSD